MNKTVENTQRFFLINSCLQEKTAEIIGRYAAQALIEEVNTSPKPGLVDRLTNGAHTDMNLYDFYHSAAALEPFFSAMALEGIRTYREPEACFLAIRKIGIEAEAAMYAATGGVNTHKGLIFSLGILCACAGGCAAEEKKVTLEHLIAQEQRMVTRILTNELYQLKENRSGNKSRNETHGEKLYQTMGVTGVRGEALSGFAAVTQIGLPVMQRGLAENRDFNRVKLQTLMTYMSQIEDTNVLSRTNPETLEETRQIAAQWLQSGGAYTENGLAELMKLDGYFISRNISHGGCADLLAISIFLVSILSAVWL